MLKRHKDLLRAIVASLRLTLAGAPAADGQRGDLDRELERLGVAPDGALTPLDALPSVSVQERRARAAADEYLRAAEASAAARAGGLRNPQPAASAAGSSPATQSAREELVERAAYSWINRLLALRAMEARGLIDETLRTNPDYDGLSEALYVLRQSEPARADGADGGWWAVIEDACKAQATSLPGLFDLADPAVALRPSTPALIRCIQIIGTAPAGSTLDEADAAFADPDAVGWAYQFYQEAAKARVYAKLGTGGKAATRAEIAAATQLFTEPYMVQWLLQNSLGRSYHEAYPDSTLPATWAYYIRNRPEGQTALEHPRPLEALDLIDPCCGSGHFLREAFDMFAAMYREQHPELTAAQIADRVLSRHLHGIDLDPRAAQLATLTLYLRAWELVRDEQRRQRRSPGTPSSFILHPSSFNIATTPSGLSAGALQRHLRRHPEDRVLKPLLEGVFAALEQADILGSLLRPAEHIDAAIKALQGTHQIAMDFEADDAALRRTITELARRDPAELKQVLLDRVAQSFAAEAGAGDVAADLFGREAERGVRLLQLLDRKYAVVVTNPPYMGSANMDAPLKKYVEIHFKSGKRDLYAAFILRCLNLCGYGGRVSMITQQSWMFQSSFAELRARSSEQTRMAMNEKEFPGLLHGFTISSIAHLGRYAFSELGNAVIAPVMFVVHLTPPCIDTQVWACRLTAPRPSEEQANLLSIASRSPVNTKQGMIFLCKQLSFIRLPESPLAYHLNENIISKMTSGMKISDIAEVRPGICTGDDNRFLKCFWEVPNNFFRWRNFAKGGGYARWQGFNWLVIDWQGGPDKFTLMPGGRVRSLPWQMRKGYTYSLIASKSLGVRTLENGTVFGHKGPGIFPKTTSPLLLFAYLNSRAATYLARVSSPGLAIELGTLLNLPWPSEDNKTISCIDDLVRYCLSFRIKYTSRELTESVFDAGNFSKENDDLGAVCLFLEAFIERMIWRWLGLDEAEAIAILEDTGTPAGFHPLVAGYDALPELPAELDLPALPQEVLDYLAAHERIATSPTELRRVKERLRKLYEDGPGAKEEEEPAEAGATEGEDDEGAASGAHIPIPTETFLEELSVKMQLHPISVYWLLEELRREGARCKREELRLLEDRLSVLVLRLLGHRWPKQIEAGEPAPPWADRDGIIALTAGPDGLAERVRARLRDEDGDVGANRAEGLLTELTGLSLEEWLRREFFKRHVRQFKYRPIAWHLASDPAAAAGGGGKVKGRGGKRQPAFECLLYYHATGGDALARVRTQYVEPLLRVERQNLDAARRGKEETAAAQAQARIHELEEFTRRLREVEEQGFACPELDKAIAGETLDRWSGDGLLAPAERDDLLRQERAWRVDLNDGVRVNIAPLQLAGLLASDVLKAADAKKAIVDRSRWRSDERRWVREGKLPRCGWMPDAVPESDAWTKLAPQREAEHRKLEEKRRAALEGKTAREAVE